MGFLQLIQLLFKVLPMIGPIVNLVETLFPNAKGGADKLAAAVQIVQTILPTVGATAQEVSALTTTIPGAANSPLVGAINAVVAATNASGGFATNAQGVTTAPQVG